MKKQIVFNNTIGSGFPSPIFDHLRNRLFDHHPFVFGFIFVAPSLDVDREPVDQVDGDENRIHQDHDERGLVEIDKSVHRLKNAHQARNGSDSAHEHCTQRIIGIADGGSQTEEKSSKQHVPCPGFRCHPDHADVGNPNAEQESKNHTEHELPIDFHFILLFCAGLHRSRHGFNAQNCAVQLKCGELFLQGF